MILFIIFLQMCVSVVACKVRIQRFLPSWVVEVPAGVPEGLCQRGILSSLSDRVIVKVA